METLRFDIRLLCEVNVHCLVLFLNLHHVMIWVNFLLHSDLRHGVLIGLNFRHFCRISISSVDVINMCAIGSVTKGLTLLNHTE